MDAERDARAKTRAATLTGRIGSVFQNPDLAATYRLLAARGIGPFYGGKVGQAIVQTVQHPPVEDEAVPVPPGCEVVPRPEERGPHT